MASSLFGNQNNPFSRLSELRNVIDFIRSGNAESIMQQMMMNNPQFNAFVEANKGKSADQILKENGINLNDIQNILRSLR